ncbi:MAG TPA: HPr family phosphocarrier protein [Syntrophales bacterium]|nr:HPr family phosphocarrier protein [Syntrophobacterales bacterium]HRR42528.1 HPr family phosphocarrier protein [Syntrophales bacterium]HRT26796.1 HPr family phosphocarrier protein [Syntrophales bacterium]HRT70351.1 HPr family phosphocarrier protein [Syntrophales bacterium]
MTTSLRIFTITNELGIHARSAALIVDVASRFRSEILIEKDGREVNAKSILGILTLGAPKGSKITVRAEGPDAQEAVDSLGHLIENKFGES